VSKTYFPFGAYGILDSFVNSSSAQSKSKQSCQRNSQPPTRNDGDTGKVIRGTHVVMLFFVNLDMIKQLLLLTFIFLKNGKYLLNISSNKSYCI
jgi:hypothetical protein